MRDYYAVTLVNFRRGKREQTGIVTYHRLKRILEAVRKRHGWRCTLSETGHFPLIVRSHRGGPLIVKIEDGALRRTQLHVQAQRLGKVFGPG